MVYFLLVPEKFLKIWKLFSWEGFRHLCQQQIMVYCSPVCWNSSTGYNVWKILAVTDSWQLYFRFQIWCAPLCSGYILWSTCHLSLRGRIGQVGEVSWFLVCLHLVIQRCLALPLYSWHNCKWAKCQLGSSLNMLWYFIVLCPISFLYIDCRIFREGLHYICNK